MILLGFGRVQIFSLAIFKISLELTYLIVVIFDTRLQLLKIFTNFQARTFLTLIQKKSESDSQDRNCENCKITSYNDIQNLSLRFDLAFKGKLTNIILQPNENFKIVIFYGEQPEIVYTTFQLLEIGIKIFNNNNASGENLIPKKGFELF